MASEPENDWLADRITGLEGVLDLAGVGVSLPLGEAYEGMELGKGRELELK